MTEHPLFGSKGTPGGEVRGRAAMPSLFERI